MDQNLLCQQINFNLNMMIKVDVDIKNTFNEFKKTKCLLLNFNHIYNSLCIFLKKWKNCEY